MGEVINFLKARYEFRYNLVSRTIVYRQHGQTLFQRLSDTVVNDLLLHLEDEGIKYSATRLMRLLKSSRLSEEFDPFKCYIEQLLPWDEQTDYIQQLADAVEVADGQQPVFRDFFRRWVVGLVACAIDEAVTNHGVLVLSGGQGIGKTRFFEQLLPNQLKPYYYCGALPNSNKDAELMLTENWLINLDELAGISKSRLENIKTLITKGSIRQRVPYGVIPENFPRRASFAATVNGSQFLRDQTGNRRFWCFTAERIKVQHGVDLGKMYAQAMHLYLLGFRFWLNETEIKQLEESNRQFEMTTMEEHILLNKFEACSRDKQTHLLMTSELLELLSEITDNKLKVSTSSLRALGIALNKHGFKRVKHEGRYKYCLKRIVTKDRS